MINLQFIPKHFWCLFWKVLMFSLCEWIFCLSMPVSVNIHGFFFTCSSYPFPVVVRLKGWEVQYMRCELTQWWGRGCDRLRVEVLILNHNGLEDERLPQTISGALTWMHVAVSLVLFSMWWTADLLRVYMIFTRSHLPSAWASSNCNLDKAVQRLKALLFFLLANKYGDKCTYQAFTVHYRERESYQ